MGKMILSFLAMYALVFFTVQVFISATGREKIQLIKLLGGTMLITVVVAFIITAIVILF